MPASKFNIYEEDLFDDYSYLADVDADSVKDDLPVVLMDRLRLHQTINPHNPKASKTFPFLKLPAEIRNKIYTLSFLNDIRWYPIGGFMTPSTARTSRQLRQECLALFFQHEEFHCDFTVRDNVDQGVQIVRIPDGQVSIDVEQLDTPRAPTCDPLCLHPLTANVIAPDTTIFRHISFHVVDVFEEVYDGLSYGEESSLLAVRSLKTPMYAMTLHAERNTAGAKYEVRVEVIIDARYQWGFEDLKRVNEDILRTQERARSFAATRRDFCGFSLRDYGELAAILAQATSDGARE